MGEQTIKGSFLLPYFGRFNQLFGFSINLMIDAADEEVAFIFQIPKTGTISKIGFLTGTVTTGSTVDVRLETVDSAGNPSGTLCGTNSNGAQVIADGDDDTWFLTSLTTGCAVNRGDLVAVTIVNPSSSFGNMIILSVSNQSYQIAFPYSANFTGSWTRVAQPCIVALEYSDGSYENILGCFPVETIESPNYGPATVPDERGMIFQLPFPTRIIGMYFVGNVLGPTDEFTVHLTDAAGSTRLASVTLDNGTQGIDPAIPGVHMCYFDNAITLSANTNFRVSLEARNSTIALSEFTTNTVVLMDAFSGGQNFHLTTQSDGTGSWTEDTGRRPLMGIICDGFEDGAGAGGLLTHPGMTGGMRG